MSLESLTKQLTALFDGKEYEKCQLVLPKIKLELIKNDLLVPSSIKNKNLNDLIITRSILEIGALSSINLSDYDAFESYILQLKTFYSIPSLPLSNNKNKLIALYLLLLLSQGLLDKFHIELENFLNENKTVDELEDDLNLKIPINLEKWIIDGDYFKIFEIFESKKFPSEEYSIFENNLLNQIRQEIIKNFNKSYTKLPLKNLKTLLFLNDFKNDTVLELIKSQPNWVLDNDVVYFEELKDEDKDAQNENEVILKNCLHYAKEIETII